jgi:hypothetical protein
MRRFAGDRSAIGSLSLDEQSFQIVGIAEKGFNGVEPGKMVDVWVPNIDVEA